MPPSRYAVTRMVSLICWRPGAISSGLNMRIRQITLRELHMHLVAPFETSVERTTLRRILLVEANVDGVSGWGECVAGERPRYSSETTDTAWHILRDHLWPLVNG